MPVKEPAEKVSKAVSRPRLTSQEIVQLKEMLRKANEAETAVPSIAHLAGTVDSEFMEELRQIIRENREKEALMLAEEGD